MHQKYGQTLVNGIPCSTLTENFLNTCSFYDLCLLSNFEDICDQDLFAEIILNLALRK